jgi:hypothetical protein
MKGEHCVESEFSIRYFYKGGSACGVDDDPDRVELCVKGRRYTNLVFELPRQSYLADKVNRMMEEAYNRGVVDNRKAIGEMIKTLIAL